MADTLKYSEPGTGVAIATDEVSDVHYQEMKLVDSTKGSTTPIPFPTALRSSRFDTADAFTAGEVLADQSGAGAVLTFTFAAAQHLIWVLAQGDGLVARIDPFGGTPSATAGIPAFHETPVPLTVVATTIKVYAPTGTTVSVWGYRYAS